MSADNQDDQEYTQEEKQEDAAFRLMIQQELQELDISRGFEQNGGGNDRSPDISLIAAAKSSTRVLRRPKVHHIMTQANPLLLQDNERTRRSLTAALFLYLVFTQSLQ